MEYRPNYMNTDKLPAGWRYCQLGEVAEILVWEEALQLGKAVSYFNAGIPLVAGVSDMGFRVPASSFRANQSCLIGSLKDDLIITLQDPVGHLNICDQKYVVGKEIAVLRPNEGVNPVFLFYSLQFAKERLSMTDSGTPVERLSKQMLEEFSLLLPDPQRQKAVADLLTQADEVISLKENILSKLEELYFKLMETAIKYVSEEAGAKEEFQMPMGWDIVAVEEMVIEDENGELSEPEQENGVQGPYPCFGRFGQTAQTDKHAYYGEYVVIITDIRDYNRRFWEIATHTDGGFEVANGALALKVSNPVCRASFLRVMLNYSLHNHIGQRQKTTITPEYVSRIVFPLPTLEEQDSLVAELRVIEQKICLERQSCDAILSFKKEYLSGFLHKNTR